jgi:oligoendopeptidase F
LFQRYKKEGSDFVPSYINILAAGGSKKPELLLEEFGIDISSSRFWQDGFDYVSEQVKQISLLS